MNSDRDKIISVITAPLGFFVLALLIVEGLLGIVLIFSGEISENFKFWGMFIGAGLFIIVVVLVWLLVWFRPKNLMLESRHHYGIEKEKIKNIPYNPNPDNVARNADPYKENL